MIPDLGCFNFNVSAKAVFTYFSSSILIFSGIVIYSSSACSAGDW